MRQNKQALLLADLGFGDAGKGTITDFLSQAPTTHLIVRYNGGPQAAHNVVTPDGQHHTFAQFGSGMFFPWTRTLLSRFMLINPLNLLKEERHLRAVGIPNALQRTLIDRRALIITPFQRALNRLREIARANHRHGSCGEGIGECMSDALTYGDAVLRAGDLQDKRALSQKLHFLREAKWSELDTLLHRLPDSEEVRQECALFTNPGCLEDCAEVYAFFAQALAIIDETAIDALFTQPGTLLFEGAQGVLLDENYGFAPYTTWSTTTLAQAEMILQEHHFTGEVLKLGIMRACATRHGAGPFPTEDPALTTALPETHNVWNSWQQTFRVGYFDQVLTRYALEVTGKLDYLAITHLDQLTGLPAQQVCTTYTYHGAAEEDLSPYFEQAGAAINAIKVHRPIDLAHQAELTRRLWQCTPEYLTLSQASVQSDAQAAQAAFLSWLTESLALPVAIAASGPTVADKRWLCDPWF